MMAAKGLCFCVHAHPKGYAYSWEYPSRCVEIGVDYFNGEELPRYGMAE